MAGIIPPTWRERWAERWEAGPGFTSLLFGTILPVITIGFEVATQGCASLFFDPIPTPLHLLLVSLVPLFNYLVWRALTRDQPQQRWLVFANGVAIAVSAVYSLFFLPLLPFAVIGIVFYGLGLLPWSPVFALIAALTFRRRLKKASGDQRPHATWPGLVCGVLALAAVDLPKSLTEFGMKMATSQSSVEQARGIRLLRAIGDEDVMLRYCYFRTGRATNLLSMLTGMGSVLPEQAREVYYRVTGEPFNNIPPPRIYRRGWAFDFDDDQGGPIVGGKRQGLSLASSRIDGSIDALAALGYLEWTLVVKNDATFIQEARSQIALPPGAIVSRLTLWVNDEEREAASGFPGWPSVFEGYPLKPLPLSPVEKRFAETFPGKIARFHDGEREVIMRWIVAPTRKVHAASDCFRASGYRVKPLPLELIDGAWGAFSATRGDERLHVREAILDDNGRRWTDVSAWYWAAVRGETKAPWRAITVAASEQMSATTSTVPLTSAE